MIKEEGDSFYWLKKEEIDIFIYNNERALIHISGSNQSNGCAYAGYYLIKLENKKLIKKAFNWEYGEFSTVVIFEQEPIAK